MKHDDAIDYLLSQDRVILGRDHPGLENSLVRAAAAGRLVRPLPGVFADPGSANSLITRVLAVSRWDPNAVICGRAAAALSFWPTADVSAIEVASSTRHAPQAGYSFQRRTVPLQLRQDRGTFAITAPSLTALELSSLDDTDAIDTALRERVVTLATLRDALQLTRKRPGNAERWQVLLDSRADPWSRAERLTHRLYRGAGLTGWVGNLKVVVPDWATYYLDIAFERQRLAIEVDGRQTHDNGIAFESDRERQNALVIAGWTVIRFTWAMITQDPDYVLWATRAALAAADGRAPLARPNTADTPWLVA